MANSVLKNYKIPSVENDENKSSNIIKKHSEIVPPKPTIPYKTYHEHQIDHSKKLEKLEIGKFESI